MLEFKHPTMTTSLSALDFFRASTRLRSSSSQSGRKSVAARKSPSATQCAKGIAAACVLPSVIFLSTEMFTPNEEEPVEKPSVDVPAIVITADNDDDQTAELPAS